MVSLLSALCCCHCYFCLTSIRFQCFHLVFLSFAHSDWVVFLDREKFILLILAWDRVYWLVGSGGKSVWTWGGTLKQGNVRSLVT